MINHIGERVEDSWYQGEPNTSLKITAISLSSALRNMQEVANALIAKYGPIEQIPPALIMYTDRGPKRCILLLSVKIAIIALQIFLNLDHILVAKTVPGCLYRNPVENINCILNLGMYRIGAMRKPSIDLEYEHKLKSCSGLSDVHKLVDESPEKSLQLLDELCKTCTQLIKDQFSHLQLKAVQFRITEEASDADMRVLCLHMTLF